MEKLYAKLNLEEVNKKSMTLKIKSNRNNHLRESNSNFWESGEEKDKAKMADMDILKMELVKEIRDMKNGLTDGILNM